MKLLDTANYERLAGCIAFGLIWAGALSLNHAFMNLVEVDGEYLSRTGVVWSALIGSALLISGIKILLGSTRMLVLAIVFSALKLITIPTSLFLYSNLPPRFILYQMDQIALWLFSLCVSIWLWRQKVGSKIQNQEADSIGADSPI